MELNTIEKEIYIEQSGFYKNKHKKQTKKKTELNQEKLELFENQIN